MTDEAERELDDIHEALQIYDLTDVKYYRISGHRVEHDETKTEDQASGQAEFQSLTRQEPGRLEARFRATMRGTQCHLVVDLGLFYTSDEPVKMSRDTMREFLSNVAFMAAYPYMRESLFTSATRLGVDPPLLGLVRLGEFEFDIPENDGDEPAALG